MQGDGCNAVVQRKDATQGVVTAVRKEVTGGWRSCEGRMAVVKRSGVEDAGGLGQGCGGYGDGGAV